MTLLLGFTSSNLDAAESQTLSPSPEYAGSSECQACHQEFYARWAPSLHGTAMQPFTVQFAQAKLTAQGAPLRIKDCQYQIWLNTNSGFMRETGPRGEKTYSITQVMGGKNVYYFLTPLERGFLQVLPVAYDVRRKEWFDTTLSALRHFTEIPEQALDWKDRPLTFNTACYKCHVSQLSNNYDAQTDSYHTAWKEPGINCETCHGPGAEHARRFRAAAAGPKPTQLGIISTKKFTHSQINDLCSSCHAKMILLTTSFGPGDRFFDHFDLVAWEHPDFYADGRDLGEDYTLASFRASPCVKNGQLDCLHCHTSSGNNRFPGEQASQACLPCHAELVSHAAEHAHHPAKGGGNQCIACHMPTTEFARMRRTDHSMRPPTPATTLACQSPNACNLCHTNETPAWAERWVRQWWSRDYQAPVVKQAELIASARRADWSRLPEMLTALENPKGDEVFMTSLLRLLRFCEDGSMRPVLIKCLKSPSPLIRAGAAEALGEHADPQALPALLAATRDDYRLVRMRAAAALTTVPSELIPAEDQAALQRSLAEYEASLLARPDDYASHYNLGNFQMQLGRAEAAVASFRLSTRLQPDFVPALVNASLAYNALRQNDQAEKSLRQALQISPTNAAAFFNLGLLLGELGRLEEAETALRSALKNDPRTAQAAYNLGIILAGKKSKEAITWCRKAWELQPRESKYAYTLAFYLEQDGDTKAAIQTLRTFIEKPANDPQVYVLLGQLLENQSQFTEAAAVYQQAAANDQLTDAARQQFAARAKVRSGQ